MLNTLSHAEYIDWLTYYSIEPFPEERQDLRTSMIVSTLIDVWTGKDGKAGKKELLSILDFWNDPKSTKEQSPEEVAEKFRALMLFVKGKEAS